MTQEEINDLRPGDELVLKDTSNDKELKAFFRTKLNSQQIIVYVERFKDTMRLGSDGISGLGRFKLIRKVGL